MAHCFDHRNWAPYGSSAISPGVGENAIVIYEEDDGLFSYCIPRITTQICDRAFENCENLTSVTLPDSLEVIDSKAFAGCTALRRVSIPASVTQIAPDVFEGCPNVTLEVVESSLAHRYAMDNHIAFVIA